MSQTKANVSNRLNVQGLQGCQSVECSIWYNIDQIVVKISVKKNILQQLIHKFHVLYKGGKA